MAHKLDELRDEAMTLGVEERGALLDFIAATFSSTRSTRLSNAKTTASSSTSSPTTAAVRTTGANAYAELTDSAASSTVPFLSNFPQPARMPETAVLRDFRSTAYMSCR